MKTPPIPPTLLEIRASQNPGFQPLVDSHTWRVALLNFTPELTPDRIGEFQRHDESDELFILLRGRCILFIGEGRDSVTQLFAQKMEPFYLYNVKSGAWHTHVLSPDAKVLIIENRNTSRANSPHLELTADQCAEIHLRTRLLWGDG